MWQSLLVYNACPQPQTEATVLVSPSLLQIDTFGKWCRCLHNVCYVKLKKRRYLDKCRLGKTLIEKKTFSFGHCPNNGGGSTHAQIFWPSFKKCIFGQ